MVQHSAPIFRPNSIHWCTCTYQEVKHVMASAYRTDILFLIGKPFQESRDVTGIVVTSAGRWHRQHDHSIQVHLKPQPQADPADTLLF